MSDGEIERMTLCIAQMAATLEAGDRAAGADMPRYTTDDGLDTPEGYATRARELYQAAIDNVSGAWADRKRAATSPGGSTE